MKKILIPIASVIAATFMVACGIVPDNTTANDSDSLNLDSIALGDMEFRTEQKYFTDTLTQNEVTASYTVTIDVPVSGNPQLVDSIKQWISSHLIHQDIEMTFDEEMLKQCASAYFQECDEDGLFEGFGAYFESSATVLADTLGFVTYEIEGYDYTGGAHGMPFNYGVTFSKEDGSQIGWDIFADTTQLAPIVKEYIGGYFDEIGVTFEEYLFEGVYDDFPLPYIEPWLTAEGVKFIYGAYEIAPYAAGMPSGVVPYKMVDKYLSDKAKKLIQKK